MSSARQCNRPGCSETAVATLAYNHQQATAWLEDLAPDSHPSTYDLCRRHATHLSVPKGWTLRDRRNLVPELGFAAQAS